MFTETSGGKMSKRKRSRAERSAAKRRWKQAQALRDLSLSNGATDVCGLIALPQPKVETDIQKLKRETAFKPEILLQLPEKGNSAEGLGDFVRLTHQWDEIRAVRERYPVSRRMLERMAFEAMQIVVCPTAETRYKLIASKLILAMANANRSTRGLPSQVDTGIPITEEGRLAIRALIEEVPLNDDSLDMREFKVEPGSPDDYAE